jgi:hypothetical protein
MILSGSVLASLTCGAAAGYLYAKRTLLEKYDRVLEEQLALTRGYYKALYKQDGYSTPEEALKTLAENNGSAEPVQSQGKDFEDALDALREYQGDHPIQATRGDAEAVLTNVFRSADSELPSPEIVEEVAARSHRMPYIISQDEFLANESGYPQVTITYYEGDEVLADDRDEVIENPDVNIGMKNLRFGHRSDDPNVVYIRNDKLKTEFEACRSMG